MNPLIFFMFRRLNRIIVVSLISLLLHSVLATTVSYAQPNADALVLGGGVGLGIYHGEFNSLESDFSFTPGLSAVGFAQYNPSRFFGMAAELSYSSLNYSISDFARLKYADNFFGPVGSTTYPGTSIAITPTNHVSISALEIAAKIYLPLKVFKKFTPYAQAGIGISSFSPSNDDGESLPTNLTGNYSTTAFFLPLGGGLEYRLADKLHAFGSFLYHRGFSDYLDGYAHYLDFQSGEVTTGPGSNPTQSDHYTTLRFGVHYQIYKAPPKSERPSSDESSPLGTGTDPGDQTAEQSRSTSPPRSKSESPQITEPPKSRDRQTARPDPVEPAAMDRPDAPNSAFELGEDELDSDGDKLSDRAETEIYGTDPFEKDSDNDGLTDGEEVKLYNTNPLAADTDGDLLSDLMEIRQFGTSPNAVDTDQDELSDNEEIGRTATDPLDADTDDDGVIDGRDNCPLAPGPIANNGCPSDETESLASGDDGQPGPVGNDVESTTPSTELPELQPGLRKEFSNIFFRPNSDDFDFTRPETMENLVDLLNFLQECSQVGILVEGHTSSDGNPNYNLKLSLERANRVRDWLIANGVSPTKLLGTIGYGDRLPKVEEPAVGVVSDEALERIRAQNRRITALVRKPCQ